MHKFFIAKITQNGVTLSAKSFDTSREAEAFVQKIARALVGRCEMKLLRHVITVREQTFESFPKKFPIKNSQKEILIIEAVFSELKNNPELSVPAEKKQTM